MYVQISPELIIAHFNKPFNINRYIRVIRYKRRKNENKNI